MHLRLGPRATGNNSMSNPAIIAVTVSIACVFALIAGYVYYRKKHEPKYIPATSEQRSRWSKLGRLLHLKPSSTSNRNNDQETSYAPSTTTSGPTHSLTEIVAGGGVDRNTSIRSIMTLPAYHPSPHPNERLIAREGERAGVDTVIEFPETVDEEEARREENMESLYQIRQARRNEINERNERRRERQEARAQGDWARLEQLRLQSQMRARRRAESTESTASSTTSLGTPGNATGAVSANSLIAEHTARTASRDRRVSSVSYADLGLARHDGTRLRADSVESDHRPLLESAASMGGDIRNPSSRRGSLFNTHVFPNHHRAASAESILTTDSELAAEITPQSSSGDRSGSDPVVMWTPSASGRDTGSEPSPPMGEPPRYDEEPDYGDEEAPPYASPVHDRGEGVRRLPSVRLDTNLPSIEITGGTPVIGQEQSPGEAR